MADTNPTSNVEQTNTSLTLSQGAVSTSLIANMTVDKQSLVTVAVCDIEQRLKKAVEDVERMSKQNRLRLAGLEKALQAGVELAVVQHMQSKIDAAAVFYGELGLPSESAIVCSVDTQNVLVTLSLFSSSRKVINHYNRSDDVEERKDELKVSRRFKMSELGDALVEQATEVEAVQTILRTLTEQGLYRRRQLSQMPQYERQAQAKIARAMLGNDEQGRILLNAVTADLAGDLALPEDLQLPLVIMANA